MIMKNDFVMHLVFAESYRKKLYMSQLDDDSTTSTGSCSTDLFDLPIEDNQGKREYKSRLTALTEQQLDHYATQMKYRLEEGYGEAI